MAKKPTREKYHSVASKTGKGWDVELNGEVVSHHVKQLAAEKAAIKSGHKAKDGGGLRQAILHKADGTIREERTYGADPDRAPR